MQKDALDFTWLHQQLSPNISRYYKLLVSEYHEEKAVLETGRNNAENRNNYNVCPHIVSTNYHYTFGIIAWHYMINKFLKFDFSTVLTWSEIAIYYYEMV